ERDYLMQDLRAFGGNDNRFVGTTVYPGTAGALIIGNTVYGLPDTNGATPTAAQVLPLQGDPELVDQADTSDFYTARERKSALIRLRQELKPGVEVSYTGIYNLRENESLGGDGFQ